jgi:predicted transcriptional regulator of viral defense system
LGIDRLAAAQALARWANQGLLRRIRRGLYAPISLAAFGSDQVLADPWLLVPQLFAPGYVGGWSAAEHWGLTEQLFRSICVLTAKPVRAKEWGVQGTSFIVRRIAEKNLFGLDTVWRGQTKIMVSSPARTIIDMLDDPALGGGVRHISECLDAYLARNGAEPSALIELAKRLGNGAVFKRLGFLASRKPGYESLAEECREYLTEGNAKLDPALPCKSLVRKWRLWIPSSWKDDKGA